MKPYAILFLAALISVGCNGQEKGMDDGNMTEKEQASSKVPEGSWKVNREYDEEGNLIRYDSIYSWSSGDDLDELASFDRDSVLQSMQSRFYRSFSNFDFDGEGFGDLFEKDSIFTRRFFNNDFFDSEFGKDFMDIDKMHERMEAMQKRFLKRYEPLIEGREADSLRPKDTQK